VYKLPEHWKVAPLKYCVTINENVLSETTPPDYRFRYMDIGSVDFYNGILGYQEIEFGSSPSRARRIVKKRDVIVSTVRTYLKAITAITDDEDVIVSTGFAVLSPKTIINPIYLTYFCKSNFFCDEVKRNSYGTSYPAISSSALGCLAVNLPPEPEQKAIADLLADKCGKTDALIENEERIIDELKEYKKSIIYKAVTKGVSNVPLKHCASINDNVLPETTHPDYRFRYIDIGSVDFYNGIMGYQEMDFANSPSRARRLVRKGNIIVSTVRTYLKAIAEIIDDKDVVVSTGFAVLSPKPNVNPRYLGYFCKSDLFCDEVERNSFGTSYPAISSSLLGSLSVILPALAEQQKIADYLDIKTSEIDNLITLKQQKISELKEYKKSLIYEYVTGKKEPPKDVT